MSVFDRKSRTGRDSLSTPSNTRQPLYSRFSPSGNATDPLDSSIRTAYNPINTRGAVNVPRYAYDEEEANDIPDERNYRTRTPTVDPSTTLPTKLAGGYVDVSPHRRNSVTSTVSSPNAMVASPSVVTSNTLGSTTRTSFTVDDAAAAANASSALLTANTGATTQMSSRGFSSSSANFSVSMRHMFSPQPWLDCNRLPVALRNGITFLSLMRFPRVPKTTDRYLPPQTREDRGKPTLVLDLDETLMHCSAERLPGSPPDLVVRFDDCSSVGYVYIRPYARLFLENTAKLFELVIFTASTQPYADQVLAKLDPQRKYIRHRLYRPHCSEVGGGYTKDLRLLGRDLSKTMLVDNSPISLALQLDNGLLCESYFGNNPNDVELVDTLHLLQQWMDSKQPIYKFLAERYGLRSWINSMRVRDSLANMIN
eukprot:GDKK01004585.1.p1 GENE.GDKK01004585.1~~GDKK01004585.1.p1  ORF type:complete len:425 (+),score=94.21 GDKK01004585.1:41-1315(+)